jgi:ATP/maltotriose-dependent transcriptional regulator MalT
MTFVIVGAGLAGAKAAETLRAEGYDGRIVLIGAESERPYERPPLSKGLLLGSAERESVYVHAADWYASHERADEALRQAIDSGDGDVLTQQLSRVGLELALTGRSRLITAALSRFSSETGEPLVAIVLRLIMDAPTFADPRRARHLLSLADRAAAEEHSTASDGWIVALDAVRCFVEARDGRSFAGASRLSDDVANRERGASLGLDLLCATAEGWLLARIGDSEKAHGVLRDVRVSAHRAGLHWLFYVASEMSIGILNDLGRWDEAVVLEDRLGDAADRFTSAPRDRVRRRVEVVAATRRYLRCIDHDQRDIGELVASDPLGLDPELSASARMLELLTALDEEQNPRKSLDEAERLMRETAVYIPRILAISAPRLVAIRLGLDGRARAKETAELVYSVLGPDSLEAAISRFILGAPVRSTEPAARQIEDARTGERAWHPASFVTATLLLARLAEDSGRASDADALTQRAVELAARYRVDRPFLAASVDGAGLVSSRLGRFGHLEDDARHIAALASRRSAGITADQVMIESLTPKERDILLELPVHQSVAEIAGRHTLSVNTVKTHLRNIYQKLGVSDRSEAVSTAQRLGLI